ncbi:homoserine dehydrogenase [Marilutibacter aestuarii]|uniref:Homoserine dehydrogenase n=1 Tax=Marilutibacter aestuarii TaxID=1706195 RepID=A0A508AMH1_9GAMM|nr:homoserine dehydrogenase [Lysobacter aestuarii]TQD48908.1 homoserine dehydrogenase [Lysobacter aestuarii]
MNALVEDLRTSPAHGGAIPRPVAQARLALLGTGTVGSAVLARLAAWQDSGFAPGLQLAHVANSRRAVDGEAGLAPGLARARLDGSDQASRLDDVPAALRGAGKSIVVDATASAEVAARHAAWLEQGIHVVTACKLARGTSLAGWQAVEVAKSRGGSQYGDAATVGAGLPLLRSIRDLRAGGDRIHAVAGVLSGSLAWLFNHYDGLRPFSGFVRNARDAGYTEPDPREDLSGEDVRRKLLILARAAGVALEQEAVEVTSLVPPDMAALGRGEVDAALPRLDPLLRQRYAQAYKNGEVLRFVARLEQGRARVGLESLPADHALAGGAGTDNRVAIWSDRYRDQPLVIQGPGAGAEVTAAGLLDDVLRIAAS